MDETPEQIEKGRKAKQLIYILMTIFILLLIAIFVLRSQG
tara:strand:- start:1050 stop:1169 length:120 start_codon:yes stop_codon:yes gene_type:complete